MRRLGLNLVLLVAACGVPGDEQARRLAGSLENCPCHAALPPPAPIAAPTYWVSANDLMPAWGYYGIPPRRRSHEDALLTWVVPLPDASTPRRIFVKQQAAGGLADPGRVLLDDVELFPSSAQMADGWFEAATIPASVSAGPHHLEVQPEEDRIIEYVLVTTEAAPILPAVGDPPSQHVTNPVVRYPRQHRLASAFSPRAPGGPPTDKWALGKAERFDEDFTNWYPFSGPPELTLRAARNQVAAGALSFAYRAPVGQPVQALAILAQDLTRDGGGGLIPSARIDVRIAMVQRDTARLFNYEAPRPIARMLVKHELFCASVKGECVDPIAPTIPPGWQGVASPVPLNAKTELFDGEQRQIWITVDTSGVAATGTESPPLAGTYRGTVRFVDGNNTADFWDVPVVLQLDPFSLSEAPGWNGVIYNDCYSDGLDWNSCRDATDPAAFRNVIVRERRDQRAHSLTSFQSIESFEGIDEAVEGGFGAGAKQAVIVADPTSTVRHWSGMGPASYDEVNAHYAAAGWELRRFKCDEPYPGNPGCEPTTLPPFGTADLVAGRNPLLTLNSPAMIDALIAYFPYSIASVTTNGLWDRIEQLRPYHPLVYWVTSPSYPMFHRALAGRFIRSLGTTDAALGGLAHVDPVFEGIFVNSYRQSYPEGMVVRDQNDPDAFGNNAPIPTAAWEALREGIDDARYYERLLQALEYLTKAQINGIGDPVAIAAAIGNIHNLIATYDFWMRAATHADRYFSYLPSRAPARAAEPNGVHWHDQMRAAYADAIIAAMALVPHGP